MKILVVYKSKTGFAEKYAKVIGKEANADVMELREVSANKMSEYDVVVYGAGLYAGMINGIKKVKERFAQSKAQKLVVFATGATPNKGKDIIDEMWKTNLSEELESIPHFYMQGGLCYEKMGFFSKTIMKMMSKTLEKQYGINDSADDAAPSIRSSYDLSSEEYAKEIIDYLMNL